MAGVRPICDYWILARCKHGYFGGYPSGFLKRARSLLVGGDMNAIIGHMPGGMAHRYNGAGGMTIGGFGPHDWRIDLAPECEPDLVFDVRELHRLKVIYWPKYNCLAIDEDSDVQLRQPDSIILDRPYTREYAKKYTPGDSVFPEDLTGLLRESLRLVKPGGTVGVLDFQIPSAKRAGAECLARVAVDSGDNMQLRSFTVWRRKE